MGGRKDLSPTGKTVPVWENFPSLGKFFHLGKIFIVWKKFHSLGKFSKGLVHRFLKLTSFIVEQEGVLAERLQLVVSEGLVPRFLKVTSFTVEQEGVLAERPTLIRTPDQPVKKWVRMDEVLGSAIAFKKPGADHNLRTCLPFWESKKHFPIWENISQTATTLFGNIFSCPPCLALKKASSMGNLFPIWENAKKKILFCDNILPI
eukprot:g77946.t1